MATKTCCRHLTNEDLYRTILLEEGCDVAAPSRRQPTPPAVRNGVTVYSAGSNHWIPQFRVMFGDAYAG